MKLDQNVAEILGIAADDATVSSGGGGGCSSATTSKITCRGSHGEQKYFMKTGKGEKAEVMFQGEHASLNAIHNIVPTLCPKSYGTGSFASSPSTYFLVTDYIDLQGRSRSKSQSSQSLAQKLAKLHTTPAPVPEDFSRPMFGFDVVTCCGDTPQRNWFVESWEYFYANHRLRAIGQECSKKNGKDAELEKLIEDTADQVVPALLGDGHLGGPNGITPVVIHGDLWSGNAGTGSIGTDGAIEEIVFDPSAVLGHSEYELGIMKMFGGFGPAFLKEYHELCPKTEPVAEYEDRVALYELYHHLNHHALFGGGYRSGAVSIMQTLLRKYGKKAGERI